MTGTRNLRPTRPWVYLLLFGALLAAGCSSTATSEQALVSHLDAQGNSIPGWVAAFPGPSLHSKSATEDFINSGSSHCADCHGADLTGGISKVSCFTSACHHNPVVTNWSAPAVHGASAKKAPGSSSFFSCQICHAKDFSGGGAGIACAVCHGVPAPHPATPWRAALPALTHTNTDQANAPVCDQCHHLGANSTRPPSPPAPAGTPPGCFNNTLCHGAATPHILGATWTDPTSAAFHGLEAKRDLGFCQSCHGTPGTILFDGGSAPTKCSDCHTASKAHPTTWSPAPVVTFPGYVASHRNSLNQSTTCSICHDFTQGRSAPNPAAPSCFSAAFTNADSVAASCHAGGPGGANHAVPFFDNTHFQATQTTFNADCATCHAVAGTSPVSTAPLCTICHTAGSPLTLAGCTSCHASPPDNVSLAAYPNIAGAHTTHLDLNNGAGTPVTCNTCHNGLGSNTLNHYNRANGRPGAGGRVPPGDAAFLAAYNAETGATSFDNVARTCSNVSCHGGQPTPDWRTAVANAIDVPNACLSCHVSGTSQFNSFNSGEHDTHIEEFGLSVITCKLCHNTTTLADGHFAALATPEMEGPASDTIGGGSALVTTYVPGGTPGTGSCTPSNTGVCHNTRTW
jgi:predicted CxxxxCH...CXXCH cytochrome family protein